MIPLTHLVPHPVFCAYLKGGRLWPQLRGGINIAVLATLMEAGFPQFPDFVQSRFTQKQLSSAKLLMEQDHCKAGVFTVQPISDSLMENEWEKTKRFALKSLRSFVLEYHHSDCFSSCYNEPLVEARSLQDYFEDPQNAKATEVLFKTTKLAYSILLQHAHLGHLFTLSYYQPEQYRQALEKETERYSAKAEKYGIPSPKECPSTELKKSSCSKIKTLLQNHLQPYPHHWIAQGFD